MEHIKIPHEEYAQRVAKAAGLIDRAGYDVFIANSNEADFANVRYFSYYWPLFEIAAVAISPGGKSSLIIGPESGTFAEDRSKIDNIHLMTEYRESADPAYPDVPVSSFNDVFESIGVSNPKRIGVAGWLITTMPVYQGLKAAFPEAEIVNADQVMTELRVIKSQAELACLREGLRIAEEIFPQVLQNLKPGMTELQAVGMVNALMYERGAECESLPSYVFAGKSTTHAISRPTHKVLQKGDMVQLNYGARVDGYSPCIGRPVCLGKMTDRQLELVEFGREAHYKTLEWVKAGEIAANVAEKYIRFFKERGYESSYLYGPCHGLGMIEVEKPWMETISDYPLKENMTFQVDTFLYEKGSFGLRWENGMRVTKDGCELMSNKHMEIYELEV
jgi:Xaa-Pro aminopeptidase